MAVDLCSEPFDASPRISFSHDLRVSGIIPVEQTPFRSISQGSNPSFDFDSCGFDRPGWSPADELFSEGKMIPLLQIKKSLEDDDFNRAPIPKKDRHEGGEEKEAGTNCDNRNKSFWRFGRSSSLNSCSGSYGRMGLCPLPLLSRSNSTGSTPVPRTNKHSMPKPFHPRELHPSNNIWYQKPPLRRPCNGVGNGVCRHAVRVEPVLNVVSPGNMFGLCSVFGRDKRKRK